MTSLADLSQPNNGAPYTGVIIEESLETKDVLATLNIVSTKVEEVTPEHETPWLTHWTLRTLEMPATDAVATAYIISRALESEHPWYADYKNATTRYIIFKNKIFAVDRTNKAQYDEAKEHGISIGIPPHQVDFAPEASVWER